MKKLLLLALLVILNFSLFTSYSHTQWIKQNWPEFWSVRGSCFFDNTFGLVAGETFPNSQFKIYRTTNGGFNWSENYYFLVHGMQKIDSSTAYCWGVNWATSDDKILRTFDKGVTWDSINFGLNYVADLFFLNKDSGWVTIFDGNATRLYKTTNGGLTLTFLNSTGHYETTSFYLKEKYNSYYVGYRSYMSELMKTTDGGYNWVYLPSLPIVPQYNKNDKLLTPPDVTQIAFLNKDTGWVSNGSKAIFKTTNGGMNWILQPMPSNNYIVLNGFGHFALVNKDTIYSDFGTYDFGNGIYRGVVFKTTNGGINWGYQLPDTSYHSSFSRPILFNSNIGWFTYIYTTNGGGPIIFTEVKNITVENPERFQLFQNKIG